MTSGAADEFTKRPINLWPKMNKMRAANAQKIPIIISDAL